MTQAQFRRSMAAGIAFVALLVAGTFTWGGNVPNIKKHDSQQAAAMKYVHELMSSSHRTGLLIGAYLTIVAAIAFVWFSVGLREFVGSTAAGRLIGALSVVGAAAMTATAMTVAVVAGAVSFGNEKVPRDGDTIRVVMDLAFPFTFVVFALTAAAMIAILALTGRGHGLPSWLAYTAWLGVLGGIFAVIFLPMAVLLLWFLIVAIVGLARPSTPSEPLAAAAAG